MSKVFGIDISEFQAGINLKTAKKEGVKFAILRAGYTGSKNGVSKAVDSSFKTHYKNSKKQGIGVGAYWFSRATSYTKGREEAKFMYKNCLKGRKFDYPIAIDVEDPVYQSKASKTSVTNAIRGFCEYLEAKGYYVCIYANSYWFSTKMKLSKLTAYDKWVANWGKTNPKTPSHGLWQFGGSTNELRSPIIAGMTVDQDYAYKNYPKIIKAKGLNGYDKEETYEDKYTIGKYKTLVKLNVRRGAGVNYKQKKVKDLTSDGKKNATSKNPNAKAIYKKGTIFTALKIIEISPGIYWAKTPSGYVCLKGKKKVYCRKI